MLNDRTHLVFIILHPSIVDFIFCYIVLEEPDMFLGLKMFDSLQISLLSALFFEVFLILVVCFFVFLIYHGLHITLVSTFTSLCFIASISLEED